MPNEVNGNTVTQTPPYQGQTLDEIVSRIGRSDCDNTLLRRFLNQASYEEGDYVIETSGYIVGCIDCGEQTLTYSPYGRTTNWASSDYICDHCIDHWRYSERTEAWIHENDWDMEEHEYMDEDLLACYSSSPTHLGMQRMPYEKDRPNTMYLGVELEVETRHNNSDFESALSAVHNATSRFAICKSDGSLSDSGFEICTTPATLDKHRSGIWEEFFKTAPPHVYSYSSSTCGMHVHMSVASITPLTLGKMMLFMNKRSHSTNLSIVAGRDIDGSSQWCATQNRYSDKITEGAKRRSPRYSTLNTSTGKPTVEFRIFRGNIKPLSFFKNLEFCASVRDFCHQSKINDINFQSYWGWLNKPVNRKSYPHLSFWAARRNLIDFKYSDKSTIHMHPTINNMISPNDHEG